VSAGFQDAFLAALDAGGKQVWSMRLGSCTDDTAGSVAADGHGHVYVTGTAILQMQQQGRTWLAAIAPPP
jgi:hypothetical protein